METTISPDILIISSLENQNALAIQKYLKEKHPSTIVYIFDLSNIPKHAHISAVTWDDGFYISITDCSQNKEGAIISFKKIHTIWWLEPLSPVISEQITDSNQIMFAYLGCCKAIESLWYLCNVRWINPPEQIESALNPICQIRNATKSGLTTPNMLVTSSPEDLLGFHKRYQNEIWYRTFLPLAAPIKVTEQDLQKLDRLTLTPIVFQRLCGKNLFAVITLGNNLYPLQLIPHEQSHYTWKVCSDNMIPKDILAKVQSLARLFMFETAMVELERNEKNEFVFISISPWWDFLKLENEVRIPFTELFAKFLGKLE